MRKPILQAKVTLFFFIVIFYTAANAQAKEAIEIAGYTK